MTTNNPIQVPPFWRQDEAYLFINFLLSIIDAISQTHGTYLASQTPDTMKSALKALRDPATYNSTPNTKSDN